MAAAETLTFEKVWAMFRETDRKFQESRKQTDRIIQETNRQIGKLGNRFGEMIEHMIVPNINVIRYLNCCP